MFSINISNLAVGLSNLKLFADDNFTFFVVHDMQISSNELNQNSVKISEWVGFFHGN